MHILTPIMGYMAAGTEAIEQGRLGCYLGDGPDISINNSHCTDADESLAGSEEMALISGLCAATYLQAST